MNVTFAPQEEGRTVSDSDCSISALSFSSFPLPRSPSERHNSKLSAGSKSRTRLLKRVDSSVLRGHVPQLLLLLL